ncbi:MAG: lycopene cyclase domain-containing protein [Bacteroidota bacterium]|nr:lycopene cyclase domain-containing protein [Bacteroidota bacterium]
MTYTQIVIIAAVLALLLDLVVLRTRLVLLRRYWIFMAVMLVFFFIVNGILTGLPVVMYSSHAITGFRVITIPVEDFAYMYALITPTIVLYEWMKGRKIGGIRQKAMNDNDE